MGVDVGVGDEMRTWQVYKEALLGLLNVFFLF